LEPIVIKIESDQLPVDQASQVADYLISGGIIGYPTETVYGLGGDAENDEVIRQIQMLKDRDSSSPFLVLVSNRENVIPIVQTVPVKAEILMAAFWPGPLTLVFEASAVLPRSLIGDARRIGIRVSPDPVCRQLLEYLNKPLISTSANPSGFAPARSASEVAAYFAGRLGMILDGGKRLGNGVSTVLDVTLDPPRLIREGAIPKEAIIRTVGGIG
jgi:L-threonylcarbamoyladenylate synthase